MHALVKAGLATGALAASIVVAAPANAATAHCASGGTKYELNAGPSVATDLADGTQVCIKAGTQTYYTTVQDGMITNDSIMNKPGNAYLGISYIVVYGGGPSS